LINCTHLRHQTRYFAAARNFDAAAHWAITVN
jgi:hypothetical protein